ncbi:SPOSA6832_00945, partial [Sporobolomyces salmonicolor]
MSRLLRSRYPYIPPDGAVDHLVVGAGVVGLAVAERLVKAFADKTTFVVERFVLSSSPALMRPGLTGDRTACRHGQVGQETSSRNSEVIHSGIYYPINSLKTALCIRGRDLLYQRCDEHGIPYRNTGKLVLATSKDQINYLEQLHDKANRLREKGIGEVPLEWLSGDEVRKLEPDVGERVIGALLSPKTGIIIDSDTGEVVYGTRVVRIDRAEPSGGGKRGDGSEDGWVIQTLTDDGSGGEGERASVLAKSVINAAGLNAHNILNQILPESQRLKLHFAKDRGPGVSQVRHLLYPCPEENVYVFPALLSCHSKVGRPRSSRSSLSGLGTHLTMSLENEIRFGPDVQWLDPLLEGDEEVPDFWEKDLAVTDERMAMAVEEVQKILPGVKADGFAPDCATTSLVLLQSQRIDPPLRTDAGIRPKLSKKGETAVDFSVTHPAPGFISLQGIESPGLTSSLAIAELVEGMVRKEVWGLGKGRGRTVSEGGRLEGWA